MKIICKIIDSDFGFKKKKCIFRRRKAARAVVLHKNKVALMRITKKGYLTLPGGGIEKNESIKSALLREVKEETGCKVKIVKELGMIEEKRTHVKLHQISYCFLVKVIKKGKPDFTDEEVGSKTKLIWAPIEKVISKLNIDQNFDYQGKFMAKRSIAIVQNAVDYLNKNKF